MKKEIKNKIKFKNITMKNVLLMFSLLCLFLILSSNNVYAAMGYNPMDTFGGSIDGTTRWYEQATMTNDLEDSFWVRKDTSAISTLKRTEAECMILDKDEKEIVNIGQYKTYLADRFSNVQYTEMENYDYIVNKYGEKYYAWVVRKCLVGYDTSSPIHASSGNKSLTSAKNISFNTGELVYLHRTPIYDLTLFVPSRYQWWYTKNEVSSFVYEHENKTQSTISEDHVPIYDSIPAGYRTADVGGYTRPIVNIINNNISFYAPKFILTYSPVPHVLGYEGLAKDPSYIGTGAVYALMDEVNGMSVPVYISHAANENANLGALTPFWSFTSPNLPNKSVHIFSDAMGDGMRNFNTIDPSKGVWWRFEIEKGEEGYTWLSSIIALDQSCSKDSSEINPSDFAHAYYGARESLCKTGTVYGAKQHAISNQFGEPLQLGFRDKLEEAIVFMGGPLLVSSIDLAMDEALLQRNASVNFMLGMNGNLNADFGNADIYDAGYTWATNPAKVPEIGTARYGTISNGEPSYIRNQTRSTDLNHLTSSYSGPVRHIYSELQLLDLPVASSTYLTEGTISNSTIGRAFLSTITRDAYNDGAVKGFKTIGVGYKSKNDKSRSDRNVGASFKTGNLTFIRGAGFRVPATSGTINSDVSAYGKNLDYRRLPGKIYSSAIISIPTVFHIKNPDKTAPNQDLYYPGFYNFYKNDTYKVKNEKTGVIETPTTNNKVLNITYGYHSFYSYGRYGLVWDWNSGKANTLPNSENIGSGWGEFFSTEAHVNKRLNGNDSVNLENIFDDAYWSSFWSSEKNDDWGVWRNQGYLLSGNEWLSGSFPADLNQYSLELDYVTGSGYRTVRYPWKTNGRTFQSGYYYSKMFLEYYHAKTFAPNNLTESLNDNVKVYGNMSYKISEENNNLSENEKATKIIQNWEDLYQQILDTYQAFILTDPLRLAETSSLVKRTSQNDYITMFDEVSHDGIKYVSKNVSDNPYFAARNYNMIAGDKTGIAAMKEKIYSFEKEYCKRLTMSPTVIKADGSIGCKSGSNKEPFEIEGYGTVCIDSTILNLPTNSDTNRGLVNDNCKLGEDSIHQNSYSAFVDAANLYYPNSSTTYLEDLAYLWLSYNSLNELANDFSIGQTIRYHPYTYQCSDNGGVCPDYSVTYWHQSAIAGDFSNLTVLNHDTRLNNYFCSTGINGAQGCDGNDISTLAFLKTSSQKGENVTIPRLSEELSLTKEVAEKTGSTKQPITITPNSATNESGDYKTKYGPELFLLNELTGQYIVNKNEEDPIGCELPWKEYNDPSVLLESNQILCRKHEITDIQIGCPSGYIYNATNDECVEDAISFMECETGFRPFFEKCIKDTGTEIGCANPNEKYDQDLGMCISTEGPKCDVNFEPEDYEKDKGICSRTEDKNSCKFGGQIINGKCVVPINEFTGRNENEAITKIYYTGKVQKVSLDAGTYRLEAWGASGGGAKINQQGGGYAAGTITLSAKTDLYISVGGTTSSHKGGFNGGGDGTSSKKYNVNGKEYTILGYGGGGATDIVIGSSTYPAGNTSGNSTNSTYRKYRILVAGGGGGATKITYNGTTSTLYGGGGGGASGNSGNFKSDDEFTEFFYGNGASSTANGKNIIKYYKDAIFNITDLTTNVSYTLKGSDYTSDTATTPLDGKDTMGGGTTNSYYPVAGGGSGHKNGAAGLPGGGGSGFVFASSKDSNYDLFDITGTNLAGYTSYAMVDTEVISSDGYYELPTPSGGTNLGNIGDGFVLITRLDLASNLTQTCEHLVLGKEDTHTAKLKETFVGSSETFLYSGKVEKYVVAIDGKYLIEAWGAQGGSSSDGVEGGKGGYSTTVLDLKQNDVMYLYIGGQGRQGSMSSEVPGGFNGGGKASPGGGGSGGGATDIRLYNDALANRVIVAGGGGGAGKQFTYTGGYGGGSIAGIGNGAFYPRATSTGGYSSLGGATKDENGLPIASTSNAGASNNVSGGGAGGGGFYGGYAGFTYGGGGGSGFVKEEDPYGYMLDGDSIFQTTASSTIFYVPKSPLIPTNINNEDFDISIYYKERYYESHDDFYAKVIGDNIKEISINNTFLPKTIEYNCEDTTIFDDGTFEPKNTLQTISFTDNFVNLTSSTNTYVQKAGFTEFDNASQVEFEVNGINVPDEKLAIIDLFLKMNSSKAQITASILTDEGYKEISTGLIEKNFLTDFTSARLYIPEKYKNITNIKFTITSTEVSNQTNTTKIQLQKVAFYDAKDKIVQEPLVYCTVQELRNLGFHVNYSITDNIIDIDIEAPATSFAGNGTYEQGHTGNGAIRITAIELDDETWQSELISTQGTIEGEKPVFNTTFTTEAKTVLIKENISIDKVFKYDPNKIYHEVTLQPGKYTFELYGGSGGIGYNNFGDSVGRGGFTEGTIIVSDQPKKFYLYIGGKGEDGQNNRLAKGGRTTANISGGEGGASFGSAYGGGGGGGATIVSTAILQEREVTPDSSANRFAWIVTNFTGSGNCDYSTVPMYTNTSSGSYPFSFHKTSHTWQRKPESDKKYYTISNTDAIYLIAGGGGGSPAKNVQNVHASNFKGGHGAGANSDVSFIGTDGIGNKYDITGKLSGSQDTGGKGGANGTGGAKGYTGSASNNPGTMAGGSFYGGAGASGIPSASSSSNVSSAAGGGGGGAGYGGGAGGGIVSATSSSSYPGGGGGGDGYAKPGVFTSDVSDTNTTTKVIGQYKGINGQNTGNGYIRIYGEQNQGEVTVEQQTTTDHVHLEYEFSGDIETVTLEPGEYTISAWGAAGGGTSQTVCGLSEMSTGLVDTYSFLGGSQKVTLSPGTYLLEAWGAQGGTDGYAGGKGGYTKGEITLTETTDLYVTVGGRGGDYSNPAGGYNGGGRGGTYNSYQFGAGGGGATHIGLKSGTLNTFATDYNSQLLLVAGGGGGADGNQNNGGTYDLDTNQSVTPQNAVGAGGGTTGTGCYYSGRKTGYGTQTSGGNGDTGDGSFGQGGDGSVNAGGGGGGLYGGSGGDAICGGGGGSGYINTSLLSNAETIKGNTSFSNTSGTGEETGHEGNGYAKITRLGHTHTAECYAETLGGIGAFASSNINITEPTTLKILVGQKGKTRSGSSGSGGGASMVITANNVPIVVAGGGGGTGISAGDYIHAQGNIDINKTDKESKVGFGGWSDNSAISAGAGAGFYSNGSYNNVNGMGSGGFALTEGGKSGFAVPSIPDDTVGGFGGGGGTADDRLGGGGGGYTGGTAGHITGGNTTYSSGTGGSSYAYGEGETISGGEAQPTIDGSGVSISGNASKDYNGYVLIEGVKKPNPGDGHNSLHETKEKLIYKTPNNEVGQLKIITLEPGTYRLEAWGAQGGNGANLGGKGGYTSGELSVTERTDLYIMAGSQPSGTDGGTNGGGKGSGTGTGGGGASDIRLGTNSIYSRILVAGGGAGASKNTNDKPGVGGGQTGGIGYSDVTPKGNSLNAVPATMTSGGITRTTTEGDVYSHGLFGIGGSFSETTNSPGGGGGWFGGGASKTGSASGGSGFALTENTASIAHSIEGWNIGKNETVTNEETGEVTTVYNDEQYFLRNVTMLSGEENIPSKVNTTDYSVGNSGHGSIRITQIEKSAAAKNVSEIDKIIEAVNGTGYFEAIDFIKEFKYTGKPEVVTLEPGAYFVEAWGAEGGSSKTPTNEYVFGDKGEYSRGVITIENPTDVYVYVGGAAGDETNGYQGGFNGGANGSNNLHLANATASYWAGGGGGSSEVRFVEDTHDHATVVAAGGNGASTSYKVGSGIFSMNIRVAGGYGGGFNIPTTRSFIFSKNSAHLVPETYKLNDKHYLTSVRNYDKESIFEDPNGIQEIGHSGDGFVRIQRVRKKIITHPEVKVNPLAANTQYYQYTGEVQKAILEPGIYLIQTWGAIGGDGREIFDYEGGYGAYSTATIQVFNRTQVDVLVGQSGFAQSDYAGAGGGGSFVSTTTGIPISVAGGGGGAGGNGNITYRSNELYKNGQSTELSGLSEIISTTTKNKLVPGYGGIVNTSTEATNSAKHAGNGGGFYGDGLIALNSNTFIAGSSGRSFLSGGTVGYGYEGRTHGGFGGGGGTSSEYAGGGGGGYTGGIGGTESNNPNVNGFSGAGGGSYNTGYGYTAAGKTIMPSYYVSNFDETDYSSDYNQIEGNDQDGIVMITKLTDEIINQYAPKLKEEEVFAQYFEDQSIKHFTEQYFEKDSININFVDYAAQTGNVVPNEIGYIDLLPGEYLFEIWGASDGEQKASYIASKFVLNEPTQFEYWVGKKDSGYVQDLTKMRGSRTSTTYIYNTKNNELTAFVGSDYNSVEEHLHYVLDGSSYMPHPNGGYQTGHTGDGNIKITLLNIKSDYDTVDLRTGNGYQVRQPDEVRTIYYCGIYYRGGADVTEIDRAETSFSQTFEYTKTSQKVSLPVGAYKLEAWGAQGGSYTGDYSGTVLGGKGGYASAYLLINSPGNITDDYKMDVFVTVGQQGTVGANLDNTFNGGGGTNSIWGSGHPSGQGGGATHFSLMTGELKDHEISEWKNNKKTIKSDYKNKILLVAAGGAGRSHTNSGGIANGAWTGTSCEVETGTNWLQTGHFGIAGDGQSHGGGGGGGYCAGMGNSSCGGNGYGGYGWANTSYTAENSHFYIENANIYSGGEKFVDITGKKMEEGHSGKGYAKITGAQYTFTENKFHVTVDTFLEYDKAAYKYDLTCAADFTWNPITERCEKNEMMSCLNGPSGYTYSTLSQACILANENITCTNNAEPLFMNNKYVCAFKKDPVCPGDKWVAKNGRCVLANPQTQAPDKCYGSFKLNTEPVIDGDVTYNIGEVCERYLTEIITDRNNTDDPTKATPLTGEDAIILLDNIYSYRNYIKYNPSTIRGAFFLDDRLVDEAGHSFSGEPLFPQLTTDIWLSTSSIYDSNCLIAGTCTELQYNMMPRANDNLTVKIPIPSDKIITSGAFNGKNTAVIRPELGKEESLKLAGERYYFAVDPNYKYNAELSSRVWASFKLGTPNKSTDENQKHKIQTYNKLYSSNDFKEKYVMVDFIFQLTKESINIMNRNTDSSVKIRNGTNIEDVIWDWDYSITWTEIVNNGLKEKLGDRITDFFEVEHYVDGDQYYLKVFEVTEGNVEQKIKSIMFTSKIDSFKILNTQNANALKQWLYEQTGSQIFKQDIFANSSDSDTADVITQVDSIIKSNKDKKAISFLTGDMDTLDNASLFVTRLSESSSDLMIDRFEIVTNDTEYPNKEITVYAFEAMTEERCTTASLNDYFQIEPDKEYQEHPTEKVECQRYDLGSTPLALDKNKNYRIKAYVVWDPLTSGLESPSQKEIFLDITSMANAGTVSLSPYLTKQHSSSMLMTAKPDDETIGITKDKAVQFSLENTNTHYLKKGFNTLATQYYSTSSSANYTYLSEIFGLYGNASPLMLPLERFTNPRMKTDKDLKVENPISDGYVILKLSSENKPINKLTKWDALTFFYNLDVCKVDNSIEIVTKCKKYNGDYEEIPTIKNGCFIIRTDDSVNEFNRYVVNQEFPCKVYAVVSRVSGDSQCPTTARLDWNTSDNMSQDLGEDNLNNWRYEVRKYCDKGQPNSCPYRWSDYDDTISGRGEAPDTFEYDPLYDPYQLIDVGDRSDEIFIRSLDGTKSYYNVHLEYKTTNNGNYYDTNLVNNIDDACWSFGSVNYAVDQPVFTPSRIDIDEENNGIKDITFEGSYNIIRNIDLKETTRDIPVKFKIQVPNASRTGFVNICEINNAAEVVGNAYDEYGNPLDRVPSTAPTVRFSHPQSDLAPSIQYEFKFNCQMDVSKYGNNDEYKLVVEINGGDSSTVSEPHRLFDEAMYVDNVNSNFGMFKVKIPPKGCITGQCTTSNLWNIAFDFVYELNRQIDEYHTQKITYMSWVDYEVLHKVVSKNSAQTHVKVNASNAEAAQHLWRNGTDSELNWVKAANANSDGSYSGAGFDESKRDDKIYSAPISASVGNTLRAPYDYLAFKSQVTKTTGAHNGYASQDLCTDYRVNNTECWRYEHNVYHTITYYKRTNAVTKTYATYQTMLSENGNVKKTASWPHVTTYGNSSCPTSTKSTSQRYNDVLYYGKQTRDNYGNKVASGTTIEGTYGSKHEYANSTCLTNEIVSPHETKTDLGHLDGNKSNKNLTGKCESVQNICHGYNNPGTGNNVEQCPMITDWWGNQICESSARIFSDEPNSGTHPADYIPFRYFGDSNHGGGGVTASNLNGRTGTGYYISDNANMSTTTKTDSVVLQQTRTQGAANPGWVEARSHEVCVAQAPMSVSYSCPASYQYGTYGTNGNTNTTSPTGVHTTVYYCEENNCSTNTSSLATSKGWNNNSIINYSDHTHMVCNLSNSITTAPTSANIKPVGYGDTIRHCYWLSTKYTPGAANERSDNFTWWNTAPQTCFREHRDWKCSNSIGSGTSLINSDVTNSSGNTYDFSCEWKSSSTVDWGEPIDCQYKCGEDCDEYGCTPIYCDSVRYVGSCDSVEGLSGTFHGDRSPGCNNGTDSSAYCTYSLSDSTSRDDITKNQYDNSYKAGNPLKFYAQVDCSSGDYQEYLTTSSSGPAPLCYQTRSEETAVKEEKRCIRWETREYKEIKYYSTDTDDLTFNTRFYGTNIGRGSTPDTLMKQYSCNRKFIDTGDKYPDQITIKQYQETFTVQLYVETERGGKGNWILVPTGYELSQQYVPRAGEYFDVKAIATYSTTRGQQPSPMPFLSEYYNNYHNDTTFYNTEDKNGTGLYPNTDGGTPASYQHWGQCTGSGCQTLPTVLQDIVNNQDYGYCDAKISEPYGCSYSANFKQYAMIPGDRNTNSADQGQAGDLWVSNKNPTNGVCYYGPNNWNILSSSHRGPAYSGYFGDNYNSSIKITRQEASGDIISGVTNMVKNYGVCKSKTYSLCTEYQIEWKTPEVLRANGTVGTGFYVEVDDSTSSWVIEYSNSWFDAVAHYEQSLLSDSGPGVAVWGNSETYFNLVNGTPILPLCDCPLISMKSKGEVSWASSEWEVQ